MEGEKLRLPTGQLVQPQQVVLGLALLELGMESEMEIVRKLNRIVRVLEHIRLSKIDAPPKETSGKRNR
ncbi:hypothetical protein JCM19240_5846 [Vibrio maritimus]|uniref:Uncharacterized protein n=1 Tax=Vibrio maritimus TaxID=990268 RepID=A0A090SXB3_9VIBR|nr:hypothetical protein JCM19240_5846 [Vibrio maritimus]